jgi:hypothetical protein
MERKSKPATFLVFLKCDEKTLHFTRFLLEHWLQITQLLLHHLRTAVKTLAHCKTVALSQTSTSALHALSFSRPIVYLRVFESMFLVSDVIIALKILSRSKNELGVVYA